jgi:nucleotide-binding universal stress UspA family protein
MFSKIMVPVDMAHLDHLRPTLEVAADLGRHYGVPVAYVGVTAETPTAMAHNPAEFSARMKEFAAAQAENHGITAEGHGYPSHDPAIDLNRTLLRAIGDIGADLVVMASHIPNIADHLWPSHGGNIAAHARVSVFVVRIQEGA